MNKQTLVVFSIALVIVAALVAGVFYMQKGSHLVLEGSILKVRTLGLSDDSSLAIVDFRLNNPSDIKFVVRSVDVQVEDADGKTYTTDPISEVDAARAFQYHKVLGQKYNDTLKVRDAVAGKTTVDRMIALRVNMPVQKVDARKRMILRIEDVDGTVAEFPEHK